MAIKPPRPWLVIGTVRLRKQRKVERSADTYRVTSITPQKAEFGQLIDGKIVQVFGDGISRTNSNSRKWKKETAD